MTTQSPYPIVTKTIPTFYFVGVTTSRSSIMKVFPRWMQALGRADIVIEGIDHKPHDTSEAYRATVAQIKYDPLSLGGLVTTHKIALLEAARDIFDELHSSAILVGEVSSISKQGDKLWGHAHGTPYSPRIARQTRAKAPAHGLDAKTQTEQIVCGATHRAAAVRLAIILSDVASLARRDPSASQPCLPACAHNGHYRRHRNSAGAAPSRYASNISRAHCG